LREIDDQGVAAQDGLDDRLARRSEQALYGAARDTHALASRSLVLSFTVTQAQGLELVDLQAPDADISQGKPLWLVDAIRLVSPAASMFAWSGHGAGLLYEMCICTK